VHILGASVVIFICMIILRIRYYDVISLALFITIIVRLDNRMDTYVHYIIHYNIIGRTYYYDNIQSVKIFHQLFFFFFRRGIRLEGCPNLEPRSDPSGWTIAAFLWLRSWGGAPLLDKMVLWRPGVLQVRAQRVTTDQGFSAVRYYVGWREYNITQIVYNIPI